MKKFFMYLFMGVGLLYTYALARIFKNYKHDEPDDFSSQNELDQF